MPPWGIGWLFHQLQGTQRPVLLRDFNSTAYSTLVLSEYLLWVHENCCKRKVSYSLAITATLKLHKNQARNSEEKIKTEPSIHARCGDRCPDDVLSNVDSSCGVLFAII